MKNRTADSLWLWRMLRTVAGLGCGVVAIACLFLGAAVLLDRYVAIGNAGVMTATVCGTAVGIYWAYRRVSRILQIFYGENSASSGDLPSTAKTEK